MQQAAAMQSGELKNFEHFLLRWHGLQDSFTTAGVLLDRDDPKLEQAPAVGHESLWVLICCSSVVLCSVIVSCRVMCSTVDCQ